MFNKDFISIMVTYAIYLFVNRLILQYVSQVEKVESINREEYVEEVE